MNPLSSPLTVSKINMLCLWKKEHLATDMDHRTLKFLSYSLVTAVMAISGIYFYTTYKAGEPRWYFLFLAMAIALLLSYNLLVRRK